jgi:hypothetical protein
VLCLAPLVEKTNGLHGWRLVISKGIHFTGSGGGPVCIVLVVLGSQLVGNSQVRI